MAAEWERAGWVREFEAEKQDGFAGVERESEGVEVGDSCVYCVLGA